MMAKRAHILAALHDQTGKKSQINCCLVCRTLPHEVYVISARVTPRWANNNQHVHCLEQRDQQQRVVQIDDSCLCLLFCFIIIIIYFFHFFLVSQPKGLQCFPLNRGVKAKQDFFPPNSILQKLHASNSFFNLHFKEVCKHAELL